MSIYNWSYGENDTQRYYDAKIGKDYLCVFAHREQPDIWQGFYTKSGRDVIVLDKDFNDTQRKLDEENHISPMFGYPYPTTTRILSSSDAELIKCKLIWAYENDKTEVSAGIL